MLKSLIIRGFRCFDRLTVEPLARVNLFVGRNNAGKTCLLDAAQIVSAQERVGTLLSPLIRRGEGARAPDGSLAPDLRHLFRGRTLTESTGFAIDGTMDDSQARQVQVFASTGDMPSAQVRELANQGIRDLQPFALAYIGKGRRGLLLNKSYAPVAWPFDDPRLIEPRFLRGSWAVDAGGELASLWDKITLQPEEDLANSAMQIVEPAVERVALVQGGFHVKLRGHSERVPLGGIGEGVQRLLALACYLAASASGVLLIDDIDTGLHHSVFEKMWRLVIETAQRLDVQVFATTHSLDAVHALGSLHEREPDFAPLIAVHRLEANLDHSIAYGSDDLAVAARHHLEVR